MIDPNHVQATILAWVAVLVVVIPSVKKVIDLVLEQYVAIMREIRDLNASVAGVQKTLNGQLHTTLKDAVKDAISESSGNPPTVDSASPGMDNSVSGTGASGH